MSLQRLFFILLSLVVLSPGCRKAEALSPPPVGTSSEYRVLRPVTHANLSVYVIEGAQPLEGHHFLTLEESLDQQKVVVHETSNVNELTVENLSDRDIYIQSGDIIKGGKQDRVFETDFIVPPRSGKVPIAAFCVEQGRWSQRSDEAAGKFSSSKRSLASRELKLAAKHSGEQAQARVWEKVADVQQKLATAIAAPVQSEVSQSSLQLTLEHENVARASEAYVNALRDLATKNPKATGYAFAINGRMNSADVYGSHELFVKLWPKLLSAMAVEAVSESNDDAASGAPGVGDVETFLASTGGGAAGENLSDRVRVLKAESGNKVVFETRDRKKPDAWVHRNYISK